MKNISNKNKIAENRYIRTVKNPGFFLTLLDTALDNLNKDLKLKEKTHFHVQIKDPIFWPENLDLFSFIDEQIISEIKNKNCYFTFDAGFEGYCPLKHNWFTIIYNATEKYNIDPSQIIFVSSNLKDNDNIKKYCKDKNRQPINVFTFPAYESGFQVNSDITSLLNTNIEQTKINFKDKYFSSLSRRNRHHRAVGTFMLCQSSFKDHGLISHDKLERNERNFLKNIDHNFSDLIANTNYTEKEIERWVISLPLIVDYADFRNLNWIFSTKFDHIHNQTIFQIVNETLVDNFNDRSLFYSEKTFRPISCFQPFVIYGQKGCNHYLKNLGYKTYEDWFDLKFDYEDDYIKRYQKLLIVVEDTCRYLKSLTRDQTIEWKFKHQDVLIHNFKTLNNRKYTFEKLEKFILELENQIVAQSK